MNRQQLALVLAVKRAHADDDLAPAFSFPAPILAFASVTDPSNDPTQDLDADLSEDIEGHFVRLVGTFGSATVSGPPYDIDVSNEIDGTEAGNLTAAFTTGAIPTGLVALKSRIQAAADEIGTAESDWSKTVSKTIDATAPTITSSTAANNAENSVLAHSLTANESVTWSITGGADSARFELSSSTLRWASNGTKDYESPNDADLNNTYVVQVTATDAAGNATNQTITVTVTDVSDTSTTWNPSDKDAGITLSGGNLTGANGVTTDRGVRAIASSSTGKKYFEAKRNNANNLGIALAVGSVNLGSGFFGQNTLVYFYNGDVTRQSSVLATINAYSSGQWIAIAVDLDAELFWGKNITTGGNWNNNVSADPAIGVGGLSFSALTGPYFPAATCQSNNCNFTANFGGSAYVGTLPSGFGNWS